MKTIGSSTGRWRARRWVKRRRNWARLCWAKILLRRTGTRFPVLIKLLDCNEWLSVQVHPNDEQAAQMEGPDQFGKTEAWYILEAQDGAQLVAGVHAGTTAEDAGAVHS